MLDAFERKEYAGGGGALFKRTVTLWERDGNEILFSVNTWILDFCTKFLNRSFKWVFVAYFLKIIFLMAQILAFKD
jgi:hypothetical protein